MTVIKHTKWLLPALMIAITSIAVQAKTPQVEFNTEVINDAAVNMEGGYRSGGSLLGLINITGALNTRGWWKNGEFFVNIQSTYGGTPTQDLVKDMQVFSDIEHGNYTYLYQLWYKHEFDRGSVLLGKHDMNSLFFTSTYAAEYINSSFGIMPVSSVNVPVSIFPATSLGIAGQLNINQSIRLQTGIYDGVPEGFNTSPYGLGMKLSKEQGGFFVQEVHWEHQLFNKPGKLKLGGFYHSKTFSGVPQKNDKTQGNYGLYLIGDQTIYTESGSDGQGLGVFFQAGYSPQKSNLITMNGLLGFNYSGLIPNRPDDVVGMAASYASCNNQLQKHSSKYLRCETAVEMMYKVAVTDFMSLQADVQHIINPGMKNTYDNAWVSLLRVIWKY